MKSYKRHTQILPFWKAQINPNMWKDIYWKEIAENYQTSK